MKCKCAMCGRDEAGRLGRGSYSKVGIWTDERPRKGEAKRIERRLRRRRERSVDLAEQN